MTAGDPGASEEALAELALATATLGAIQRAPTLDRQLDLARGAIRLSRDPRLWADLLEKIRREGPNLTVPDDDAVERLVAPRAPRAKRASPAPRKARPRGGKGAG